MIENQFKTDKKKFFTKNYSNDKSKFILPKQMKMINL